MNVEIFPGWHARRSAFHPFSFWYITGPSGVVCDEPRQVAGFATIEEACEAIGSTPVDPSSQVAREGLIPAQIVISGRQGTGVDIVEIGGVDHYVVLYNGLRYRRRAK